MSSMILMTPSLISFSHLCLKWKTLRRSSNMLGIRKLNRKGKQVFFVMKIKVQRFVFIY
ncbi:hypothetical protein Hanom_Chr09g00778191 [Helianthus anomalus]